MGKGDWRYLSVDEFINAFLGALHSRRGRVITATLIGAAVLIALFVAPGAFGSKPKNPAAAAVPSPTSDVTVSVPAVTAPKLVTPSIDAQLSDDTVPKSKVSTKKVASTTSAPNLTTPATFPPGTFPPATFPPATFPPATTPLTVAKTPTTPDTGVVVPFGPTTTVHH